MNVFLRNRYLLQQELDKGGLSQVYLAKDSFRDQLVAIKQIDLENDKDEMQIRKRLQREYHFLSFIDHPNIIRAVDFFVENNSIYLVLEYVPGIALDYLFQEKQSIHLIDLIAIASQITQAVQILNASGIIHRDIKPSNIMINREKREIKLLDLGIGKSLADDFSQLTIEGTIVGTVDYMSPEQTAGFSSETTDIFSLGITLYQLFAWLTHSPFAGGEIFEVVQRIQEKKIIPLVNILSDDVIASDKKTYKKLSKLIKKMLAKKPKKRLSLDKVNNELISIHKLISSKYQNQENWPICYPLTKEDLNKFRSIGEKYGRDR